MGFIFQNPPTLSGSEGKRSFERGELKLGWRWLLFSHDDDDDDDDDSSDDDSSDDDSSDDDSSDEDVIGNIMT